MNSNYYAGHEFEWMQQFLNAIPRRHSKSVGFSIAAAIHHQYIYKKSNKFSLPQSIQKNFGIYPRSLPIFLSAFQKYELLKFSNSIGNSFEIELLCLPNSIIKNNTKDNKTLNTQDSPSSLTGLPRQGPLGNLVKDDRVNLAKLDEVKQRRKEGSKGRRRDRRKGRSNQRREDGRKV